MNDALKVIASIVGLAGFILLFWSRETVKWMEGEVRYDDGRKLSSLDTTFAPSWTVLAMYSRQFPNSGRVVRTILAGIGGTALVFAAIVGWLTVL